MLALIKYPAIDPVALELGPLAVRWYGLAYLSAFALGYLALRQLARRGRIRLSPSQLPDFVIGLTAGVLLGGRLGWWLFYHRGGAEEPWYEPLATWHGGMSFHGGMLGVVAVVLLWSWRRQAPFWNLADGLAMVAPIGLFLGRIANFVNAELVGRVTTVPWGVVFPGHSAARHPSQLYEAILEGPLLLLVLWYSYDRLKLLEGRTAALFVLLYGVFRFGIEFTREPDEQLGFVALGWLTMGQLLSAGMVLAGLILWTGSGNGVYQCAVGASSTGPPTGGRPSACSPPPASIGRRDAHDGREVRLRRNGPGPMPTTRIGT